MATETLTKSSSYPQLVYEAIEALNAGGGSSKPAIFKYIESKYGSEQSSLLSLHLENMKKNGDLIFVKNNYMKPDASPPEVPQKRGRGRPPKPKPALPAGAESVEPAPTRPRGRPRKDPNAPPTSKKPKPSSTEPGRPRGRPRKVQAQDNEDSN